MEPVTIITSSIALINLALKTIEAANNGDNAAAQAYMKQAEQHISSAVAGWNAAPGPEEG